MIFRWNSTGTTVAEIAIAVATSSRNLYMLYGIALDATNSIYIADHYDYRIQKFLFSSLNGSTVAGQSNGVAGTSSGSLYYPAGIALDSSGNLYIVDNWNHRVQLWVNGSSSGNRTAGTGSHSYSSFGFNLSKIIIYIV